MRNPDWAAAFRASADAYDRHIGRYGPELARALCDAAFVRTGQRALDVGCGPGALAQLVVNFMSDPPAGVGEMARVTRPGGVVGCAVWDYAGQMTLLRCFWDAAVALDPAAAPLDEGRSMPFCTPQDLAGLWSGAGLADVDVAAVEVGADYDGFEDLWLALEAGVGPSGAYVLGLDIDGRAALADGLQRRLRVGSRPFRLTARAWVATGVRR